MKIINKTKDIVIAKNGQLADKLISRCVGLIGRRKIDKDEGLVITKCNSIHSFFMQFSICAIFIDKNGKVVKILHDFKPYCMSGIYFKADKVIELSPLRAKETGTEVGDIIEFKK
jgi:uncharacterized membrane protein (UPF0127 family)